MEYYWWKVEQPAPWVFAHSRLFSQSWIALCSQFQSNTEVIGLLQCIQKMVVDPDKQHSIDKQLQDFKN